jgi:asparagine synthase (glutamine-hydrolysing)
LAISTLPADEQAFEHALNSLRHRGPDDEGVYVDGPLRLGHRRLAIIDLTKSGHQPMVSASGRYAIVFNGEIYNYVEIRSKLIKERGISFRSTSDTEVLLAALETWGTEAINQLNGDWAFALWDRVARTLLLCRDRFGVKPLYYFFDGHQFAFASEPKALLRLFPDLRRVNDQTLVRFLGCGELFCSDDSFYSGIKLLAPAHFSVLDTGSGKLTVTKYWNYPRRQDFNEEDIVDEFRALFDDAVRLRLRSDVTVGLTLSGGIDSTAILSSAVRSKWSKGASFVSVNEELGIDESTWAEKAIGNLPIPLRKISASKMSWLATLSKVAWHMDCPGYSPAVYPLWEIARAARSSGIPVLLEGQGADEEAGGYPQYLALMIVSSLKKLRLGRRPIQELALNISGAVRTFSMEWAALWILRELFPRFIAPRRQRYGAAGTLRNEWRVISQSPSSISVESFDRLGYGNLTRRLVDDHAFAILPGLLQYGDAITMAHGVESRLPFMDHRLVEWLFSRDDRIKIRSGQTKWILREYLRTVGQSEIGNRHDKKGFPTPVDQWLASDNGAVARELLLASDSMISKWCDHTKISELIGHHVSGVSGTGNHLYRLLSTEIWLRECIGR